MISYRGNGIDWRIITAIAGLILLAGAQQPSRQGETANGKQSTESATAKTPSASASPESAYRPYIDRYSDACYETENYNSADLCAQWRSAIAAENATKEASRATNWAIIATVLSAIGVGGLIYTVW